MVCVLFSVKTLNHFSTVFQLQQLHLTKTTWKNMASKYTRLPSEPLHLSEDCQSKAKRIRGEKSNDPLSKSIIYRTSAPSTCQELSTAEIIKMARARLHQCTSKISDIAALLISDGCHDFPGLSSQNCKDIELVLLLEAAALKFSTQQFERARKLLNLCQLSASLNGNSVQRAVYYFAKALQERIRIERGKVPERIRNQCQQTIVEEAFMSLQPAAISFQLELPFYQISQFAAIQAILENVESAKRIHLVDLGIKTGSHWPILMQALSDRHDNECPIELLKITAVGPSKKSNEEIGRRLSSFAESLNIPFVFKLVESEMKDLNENFFELVDDEVLVVHARIRLASLLSRPDHLQSLVGTIKKLNPCLLVVTEIEAQTNTRIFMDRFDAALSFCAAVFDCLEDCVGRDNQCRRITERLLCTGIENVITTEGEEMICGTEKIDFWRAFFTGFGFSEIGLSNRALCQANFLVKSNPSWSSCNLEVNGKGGLIVGWKGTPVQNLTVWKLARNVKITKRSMNYEQRKHL